MDRQRSRLQISELWAQRCPGHLSFGCSEELKIIQLFGPGWWFGTFFAYIGNNHPNWLISSEELKPSTRKWLFFSIKTHGVRVHVKGHSSVVLCVRAVSGTQWCLPEDTETSGAWSRWVCGSGKLKRTGKGTEAGGVTPPPTGPYPSLLWCVFRVGSMICRDIMEPRSFMMLLIVYSLIPMSGPSLRAKSAATEEKKGHFCSVALLHLHSCQTVLQPLLPQISSFSWHLVAS